MAELDGQEIDDLPNQKSGLLRSFRQHACECYRLAQQNAFERVA
jgi:hypothetical protein